MFCKYCGADVEQGKKKCPHCGREISAMSDCGGFFDLIPGAKDKFSSRGANETGGSSNEKSCEFSEVANSAKLVDKKGNKAIFVALGVSFAIIAVLLSVIVVQVREHNRTFSPQEQDVVICATFEEVDEKISLKTLATADDAPIAVVEKVIFDENGKSISGIAFDLDENEECVNIAISKGYIKNNGKEVQISIQIEADESVFLEPEDDAIYKWSYRTTQDSEWNELDINTFVLSENGESISYDVSALEKLSETDDKIELQLTYSRNNEMGGSLSITISGIIADN